jgi:acetyl-CoA synthetase
LPGIGPFKPAFTGLPFPGINFDILDEKGDSCPAGKQGNLVILSPFSPGLLRGIYKDEKKYRETYWSQYGAINSPQAGKIYFTSDGAYKDENGLIRIVGRVDDVIKVAGHRVSTGELENAVVKHPDIIECAVVGVPDEIKGETPVVFMVSKTRALAKGEDERSSLTTEKKNQKINHQDLKKEVVEQIKKEIGPIALPKGVFLVEDLPKTRSGKIMRRILKKLFTGEELGDLSTLSNPESVQKIKKILTNEKGAIVFLLDFLFIAVGIAILIISLLKNEEIIKWLLKR